MTKLLLFSDIILLVWITSNVPVHNPPVQTNTMLTMYLRVLATRCRRGQSTAQTRSNEITIRHRSETVANERKKVEKMPSARASSWWLGLNVNMRVSTVNPTRRSAIARFMRRYQALLSEALWCQKTKIVKAFPRQMRVASIVRTVQNIQNKAFDISDAGACFKLPRLFQMD